MGGTNFFTVLITTVKAKITPLVTKFKYWTSWSFIKTRIVTKVRDFFTAILDVRPKHRRDYYDVFGWLISKRLAFAMVVVVGVFSIYYLFGLHSIFGQESGTDKPSVKTYSYNSLLLRFASDKVRITGDSGYLAYEGYVDGGAATGEGTLYNPSGSVVYRGNFDKSMYNGNGFLYYPDGTVMHHGSFKDNLYEGEGKHYRMNGSLEYSGGYALGLKEGEGILYDATDNAVYTGNFVADELQYSDLLGKTTKEAVQSYTGKQILYSYDDEIVSSYADINAYISAHSDDASVEDGYAIDAVYVLHDYFKVGSAKLQEMRDIEPILGSVIYQGNSCATLAEAVIINEMNKVNDISFKPVDMDIKQDFTEAYTINQYDDTYEVYIYSFQKGGLVYNFICRDRNSGFLFYYIEKGEGGAKE